MPEISAYGQTLQFPADVDIETATAQATEYFDNPENQRNISGSFLDAIKRTETGNNPNQTSPKRAEGPYQLMPLIQNFYGNKLFGEKFDPFNEDQAREVATAYLADMGKKYSGDNEKMLAAYNAGETNVDKALKKAEVASSDNWQQFLPEETINYIPKTMSTWTGTPAPTDTKKTPFQDSVNQDIQQNNTMEQPEPNYLGNTIKSTKDAITTMPQYAGEVLGAANKGLEYAGNAMMGGLLGGTELAHSGLLKMATDFGVPNIPPQQPLAQAVQTVRDVRELGAQTALQNSAQDLGWGAVPSVAIGMVPQVATAIMPTPNKPQQAARAVTDAEKIIQAGDVNKIRTLTSDVVDQGWAGKGLSNIGQRIPMFGSSGQRAAQQQERIAAVKNIEDILPQVTDGQILENLSKNINSNKRGAGAVIADTFDKLGTKIKPLQTQQKIEKTLKELQDTVFESTKDTKTIKKLVSDLEAMKKGGIKPSTLREYRTKFREFIDTVDFSDKSQMGSNEKRMLTDIYSSITKDLDAHVMRTLGKDGFKEYKEADNAYREVAEILSNSKIKTLLDNKQFTPEVAGQMLTSLKPSQLRLLYNNLDNAGRKMAQSRFLQLAVDKSRYTNKDLIDPTAFAKFLNKHNDTVKIFFDGDKKEAITGLRKVLLATQRADSAAGNAATGQNTGAFISLMALGEQLVHGNIAGTASAVGGAAVIGSVARIYESAPMRNMLVKIGQETDPIQQQIKIKQFANAALKFIALNPEDQK